MYLSCNPVFENRFQEWPGSLALTSHISLLEFRSQTTTYRLYVLSRLVFCRQGHILTGCEMVGHRLRPLRDLTLLSSDWSKVGKIQMLTACPQFLAALQMCRQKIPFFVNPKTTDRLPTLEGRWLRELQKKNQTWTIQMWMKSLAQFVNAISRLSKIVCDATAKYADILFLSRKANMLLLSGSAGIRFMLRCRKIPSQINFF